MEMMSQQSLGGKYLTRLDGPERLAGQHRHRREPVAATEKAVAQWLGRAAGRPDRDLALEALGWSLSMPGGDDSAAGEASRRLLDRLVDMAREAQRAGAAEDPLLHQLLAGELALTLACRLPGNSRCRKLLAPARKALSAGLTTLVDRQGLLHARHLALLEPLLACWTRCRALAAKVPGGCWNKTAQQRFQRLVLGALRLARHDSTQAFSNGEASPYCAELLDTAVRLSGDADERRIAAAALPGKRRARPPKTRLRPAAHSEQAATAVCRTDWSRQSARLAVLYPDQSVCVELACGGAVLCSGPWRWEVSRNGRPVRPVSSWEATCWVSDDDVDYLELEIQLAGGLRIERHLMLSRKDRCLLMADAVLGERPGKLEYRGWLPLAPGISFQGAKETREGFLLSTRRGKRAEGFLVPGKQLALVVPLGLPEWRSHTGTGDCPDFRASTGHRGADAVGVGTKMGLSPSRAGELHWTPNGLQLEQTTEGRRLFAPLWIDLDRRRFARRFTWRQLTVAAAMKPQPADVAVGYRMAAGNRQWLVYRSLAGQANRTVLGHNLLTETLVARFVKGEVEPLIEIE